MLELKNITKDYLSGDMKVQALKGINLEFRKSEFVSILGQSGCGKTTLLNIIGGLDRYTSGDLIINGKSTKKFKDKDWDAYRNYSVGFVFQNYNLIQHQTVLSNVELALTLSGVSKKERKQKAIRALEKVGLKDQIHKKPNQMSGGQMQRVAIARALVNDPDIILADEPTGALDTETSVQIMNILKEISKNKLIIMVTHNPELAEKYSSRIVKILDGKIMNDSNPYTEEDKKREDNIAKTGKTSMNYFTALSLSLNNLMTKKGRTFLTAFAGSIGIIGIALILSLSNGVQNYIQKVQEDTLSSYPITIQEESVDMASMMVTMMEEENQAEKHNDDEKIYSRNIMGNMLSTLSTKMKTNNLQEFKNYIENGNNKIKDNANAVQYSYDLDLNLYSEDTTNGITRVNPSTVMTSIGLAQAEDTQENTNSSFMMSMSSSMSFGSTNVWSELIDNEELLNSQYDVVAGKMPEKYNEVVLIVDKNNEVSDYTLYALGLKSQSELKSMMKAIENGEEVEKQVVKSFTYDELLNLSFKLLLNTDFYEKVNGLWINKSNDQEYMKNKIAEAEGIKVVGILRAKEESNIQQTSGEIGYTKSLTEYVINKVNESDIVKEQKGKPEVNVLTGLPFVDETDLNELNSALDYANFNPGQQVDISGLNMEEMANFMSSYAQNSNATYKSVLKTLGAVDLDKPSTINIYPKSFEAKEKIADAIEEYNQKQRDSGKEENVITYSDLVGMMMSSVTTIVNMISYVLIAFVSISLVVSSIMIGIITYISVLERTKEIGILRAIGASKKDISRVFNAETIIVGFAAGAIGIGVTLLLNIPVNAIIKALAGVSGISTLPVVGGVVLVIISIILTVIAGLIPSKVASKKDPVEALRTE
ncbi:MAG: ABC transporter ATP-binding protein/permease [Clostridia bacterium]|nr:ABC transporter ATP-binding protein/permease [Clostridia bacterium]